MTDIPVLAITADGQTQTTLAKAFGLQKRRAPRCDELWPIQHTRKA